MTIYSAQPGIVQDGARRDLTRPAGGDSSAVPSPPPISGPVPGESPVPPGEHVFGRDVPDGAAHPHVVWSFLADGLVCSAIALCLERLGNQLISVEGRYPGVNYYALK